LRLVGQVCVFGVSIGQTLSNRHWKMKVIPRVDWCGVCKRIRAASVFVQPGVSGHRTIIMDVQYAEKITVPL